jgi:signal transduction histidine kinase
MEKHQQSKLFYVGIILLLSVIIFLLDLLLPLGIIIWIFYLVPVAIAQQTQSIKFTYLVFGFVGILMAAVLFFPHTGIPISYSIFNRTIGLTIFLFITYLLNHQKESQSKICELNNRFDIAAKAASTGVWDFDVKNNVNTWDETTFRIYGIEPGYFEKSYDGWVKLLDPDDAERAIRVFKESLAGSGDYQDIFTIIRGDGEKRYIKSFSKIKRDRSGNPIRTVGLNIDITEQRITEENLQKLNEKLLQSNQELEHFAYVASHDLQEPLRMISSFSQLLEKKYSEKLDQEAHEFIAFIVGGAAHMQHLISDLLDYSRVTRLPGEYKPVDMNCVIKRVLDNLQVKIESCNVVIKTSEMPVITGDEIRLVRLFQNLIDNAIKFSNTAEHPTIEVECKPGFNSWKFAVKDNGIGLDMKNKEKIFEIFQRLNPRDKYPGTGIGLAICRKIVEQHGGQIWVESEPDKGTTFLFTVKK